MKTSRKKTNNCCIKEIKSNGNSIYGPPELVDAFNDHFSSIGPKLASQIYSYNGPSHLHYLEGTDKRFELKCTDPSRVFLLLSKGAFNWPYSGIRIHSGLFQNSHSFFSSIKWLFRFWNNAHDITRRPRFSEGKYKFPQHREQQHGGDIDIWCPIYLYDFNVQACDAVTTVTTEG